MANEILRSLLNTPTETIAQQVAPQLNAADEAYLATQAAEMAGRKASLRNAGALRTGFEQAAMGAARGDAIRNLIDVSQGGDAQSLAAAQSQLAALDAERSNLRSTGGLRDALENGRLGDYALETLGGAPVNLLPQVAAAVAGGTFAGKAGAMLAGAGSGYSMNAGDVASQFYDDPTLRQQFITNPDAIESQIGQTALTNTAMDVGPGLIASRMGGGLRRAVQTASRSPTMMSGVGGAIAEGVPEAVQDLNTAAAISSAGGQQFEVDPWKVGDSFLGGAIQGGGISAVGAGVNNAVAAAEESRAKMQQAAVDKAKALGTAAQGTGSNLLATAGDATQRARNVAGDALLSGAGTLDAAQKRAEPAVAKAKDFTNRMYEGVMKRAAGVLGNEDARGIASGLVDVSKNVGRILANDGKTVANQIAGIDLADPAAINQFLAYQNAGLNDRKSFAPEYRKNQRAAADHLLDEFIATHGDKPEQTGLSTFGPKEKQAAADLLLKARTALTLAVHNQNDEDVAKLQSVLDGTTPLASPTTQATVRSAFTRNTYSAYGDYAATALEAGFDTAAEKGAEALSRVGDVAAFANSAAGDFAATKIAKNRQSVSAVEPGFKLAGSGRNAKRSFHPVESTADLTGGDKNVQVISGREFYKNMNASKTHRGFRSTTDLVGDTDVASLVDAKDAELATNTKIFNALTTVEKELANTPDDLKLQTKRDRLQKEYDISTSTYNRLLEVFAAAKDGKDDSWMDRIKVTIRRDNPGASSDYGAPGITEERRTEYSRLNNLKPETNADGEKVDRRGVRMRVDMADGQDHITTQAMVSSTKTQGNEEYSALRNLQEAVGNYMSDPRFKGFYVGKTPIVRHVPIEGRISYIPKGVPIIRGDNGDPIAYVETNYDAIPADQPVFFSKDNSFVLTWGQLFTKTEAKRRGLEAAPKSDKEESLAGASALFQRDKAKERKKMAPGASDLDINRRMSLIYKNRLPSGGAERLLGEFDAVYDPERDNFNEAARAALNSPKTRDLTDSGALAQSSARLLLNDRLEAGAIGKSANVRNIDKFVGNLVSQYAYNTAKTEADISSARAKTGEELEPGVSNATYFPARGAEGAKKDAPSKTNEEYAKEAAESEIRKRIDEVSAVADLKQQLKDGLLTKEVSAIRDKIRSVFGSDSDSYRRGMGILKKSLTKYATQILNAEEFSTYGELDEGGKIMQHADAGSEIDFFSQEATGNERKLRTEARMKVASQRMERAYESGDLNLITAVARNKLFATPYEEYPSAEQFRNELEQGLVFAKQDASPEYIDSTINYLSREHTRLLKDKEDFYKNNGGAAARKRANFETKYGANPDPEDRTAVQRPETQQQLNERRVADRANELLGTPKAAITSNMLGTTGAATLSNTRMTKTTPAQRLALRTADDALKAEASKKLDVVEPATPLSPAAQSKKGKGALTKSEVGAYDRLKSAERTLDRLRRMYQQGVQDLKELKPGSEKYNIQAEYINDLKTDGIAQRKRVEHLRNNRGSTPAQTYVRNYHDDAYSDLEEYEKGIAEDLRAEERGMQEMRAEQKKEVGKTTPAQQHVDYLRGEILAARRQMGDLQQRQFESRQYGEPESVAQELHRDMMRLKAHQKKLDKMFSEAEQAVYEEGVGKTTPAQRKAQREQSVAETIYKEEREGAEIRAALKTVYSSRSTRDELQNAADVLRESGFVEVYPGRWDTDPAVAAQKKKNKEVGKTTPKKPEPGATPGRKMNRQAGGIDGETQPLEGSDKELLWQEIYRMAGAGVELAYKRLAEALGGSGEYREIRNKRGEVRRIIEIAVNATNPMAIARHEALHAVWSMLDTTPQTRKLLGRIDKALNRPAVRGRLIQLLAEQEVAAGKSEADALLAARAMLRESPEELAAYAFQFWVDNAQFRDLLRDKVPADYPYIYRAMSAIAEFLRGVIGAVSEAQQLDKVFLALHSGQLSDPTTVNRKLQAVAGMTITDKAVNMVGEDAANMVARVIQTGTERVRSMNVPALNKLMDDLYIEVGEQGYKKDFTETRQRMTGVWMNRLANVLNDATDAQVTDALVTLQNMQPAKEPVAKAIRGILDELHTYVNSVPEGPAIARLENYFPRQWNQRAIAQRSDVFRQLLIDEGNMEPHEADKVVEDIQRGTGQIDLAENEHHMGYAPFMASAEHRQLKFIDKDNAHKFREFQYDDLQYILENYIRAAVHRTEYARKFGAGGEKIEAAFKQARAEGATQDELDEATRVVKSIEGTLNQGAITPTMQLAQSSALTMLNVALLPLALVSQTIDPLALAARSGNLRDAVDAYIESVKAIPRSLSKTRAKDYHEDLAELIGVIQHDVAAVSLGAAAGGMDRINRKINDRFFKYNGMQAFNNSMRVAATRAGEQYIIRHQNDKAKLQELGLKPDDVLIDGSTGYLIVKPYTQLTGAQRQSAGRLQEALFRFVEQSVIHPNSAQQPVWMSDPRFQLLAHMRRFAYGFDKVIMQRAKSEMTRGNAKPYYTLMGAMPVILAADMAKWATFGGDHTAAWGASDFFTHAFNRAGLHGRYGAFASPMPGPELVDLELGPALDLGVAAVEGDVHGVAKRVVPLGLGSMVQ